MHDEHQKPKSEGYEVSDLSVKSITVFAVIVFAVTVAALVVAFRIVRGFEDQPKAELAPIPAELTTSEIVREPELEVDPVREREAVLVPTKQRLHSAGPVAEAPRRVHIPITDAIDLLASGRVPYKRSGNESVEVPTLGPPKLTTMLETGEAK